MRKTKVIVFIIIMILSTLAVSTALAFYSNDRHGGSRRNNTVEKGSAMIGITYTISNYTQELFEFEFIGKKALYSHDIRSSEEMEKYIGVDKSSAPLITSGTLFFTDKKFGLKIIPVKRSKLRKDIRGVYDLCGDLLYKNTFPQLQITISQNMSVSKDFEYMGEHIYVSVNYDSGKLDLQIAVYDNRLKEVSL